MKEISSVEQVRTLLKNRPQRTETYHVVEGQEAAITAALEEYRTPGDMRQMTPEEMREVAEYLEINAEEILLSGPFNVHKEMVCPNCNRNCSFLDIAKTAIESGAHSKEMVRDIVLGKRGMIINISGANHERLVKCADCKTEYPLRSYNRLSYDWG